MRMRVERPEMRGPGRRGAPGAGKRGLHSVHGSPESAWLPHVYHEMILTASQKRVIVYLQHGSFQSTSWPTHAGPPTCPGSMPARTGARGIFLHWQQVANMRPSAGWKMLSVQILPWREGPTGCFQDARLRDEQRVTQSKNEAYWLAE